MRAHELLTELAQTTVNSLGRIIAPSEEAIKSFWTWFGKSKVIDRTGSPLVVYHGTAGDFRAFDSKKANSNTGTGVPHGCFIFTGDPDVANSYTVDKVGANRFPTQAQSDEFRRLVQSGSFEDQMEFLDKNPTVPGIEYKDGGNVMPVYLRMEKPLRVDAKGYHWHDIYFQPKNYRHPESFTTNEIAEYAKVNGYDGVIIKNVKDVHKAPVIQATTYIVFNPRQIKSAITNAGFDSSKHEIDETIENSSHLVRWVDDKAAKSYIRINAMKGRVRHWLPKEISGLDKIYAKTGLSFARNEKAWASMEMPIGFVVDEARLDNKVVDIAGNEVFKFSQALDAAKNFGVSAVGRENLQDYRERAIEASREDPTEAFVIGDIRDLSSKITKILVRTDQAYKLMTEYCTQYNIPIERGGR
jgi:hypothetical protein